LNCRNCGDPVDPRRVELGYDYCLKDECQQRCLQRVRLAAVGVNKAADYYTTAEEVLPPSGPPLHEPLSEPDDDPPATSSRRHPRTARAVSKSTLTKLREREQALDAALEANYQRFRAGELTATEMDAKRRALIGDFNRMVRGENIRYRGMLRKG
jgi:hypothetical protein